MLTRREPTERLKALFGHTVGDISPALEQPARNWFGGENNLLDDDEIADLSLELQHLIGGQLNARDPFDDQAAEFRALRTFFRTLAHKVLVRGGQVEDIVRYIQVLQIRLTQSLEEDTGVPFTRSHSVLRYFSELFIEMILEVFHTYLSEKEQTISSQESELRETATPITEIWDGVLTLPIIGTLDSSRTMLIMEALLARIAADRTKVVVMDLTGVSSIDSQVSHHLIQMVHAIQLMGADAVVTGIRPEIARALTSLNIDLGSITTRATLSDGLKEAFRRLGIQVVQGAV